VRTPKKRASQTESLHPMKAGVSKLLRGEDGLVRETEL